MDVGYRLVPMPVAVRLTRRIAWAMGVLVMFVVDVTMIVLQQLMLVRVFMPLSQVQPNAGGHEPGGDPKARGQAVAKKQNGTERTDEGRNREVGTRACGAEVAQREYEQREAKAVAKETDRADGEQGCCRGQLCSQTQRQGGIHAAGAQSFKHRNLHRIAGRNLPSEVVVDSPGSACARDGERTPRCANLGPTFPRETQAARRNERHSQGDTAVEILAEHKPREQRGEHALQVQQQRGG